MRKGLQKAAEGFILIIEGRDMRNARKIWLALGAIALFSWSGYSQTFVPASNPNNGNNANNGQPSPFPQLQGTPFGSPSASAPGGAQGMMPTLSNPAASNNNQAQKGQSPSPSKPVVPSFPQISPASSPKTFVPGYHPVVPVGLPSAMNGGSGGYGGNRSPTGTYYSPAPTYTPPTRSAPPPSSNSPKPSSVVIPNAPANAQKVNPTYVQPNSNGNAGSAGASSPQTVGSSNLTPQACVATGACK